MQLSKDPSWLVAEAVYNAFLLMVGDGRQIPTDVQVETKLSSLKKQPAIVIYRNLPNGRESRYAWVGAYVSHAQITITLADKTNSGEDDNLGPIPNVDALQVSLEAGQYNAAAKIVYDFLIGY